MPLLISAFAIYALGSIVFYYSGSYLLSVESPCLTCFISNGIEYSLYWVAVPFPYSQIDVDDHRFAPKQYRRGFDGRILKEENH